MVPSGQWTKVPSGKWTDPVQLGPMIRLVVLLSPMKDGLCFHATINTRGKSNSGTPVLLPAARDCPLEPHKVALSPDHHDDKNAFSGTLRYLPLCSSSYHHGHIDRSTETKFSHARHFPGQAFNARFGHYEQAFNALLVTKQISTREKKFHPTPSAGAPTHSTFRS